MLNFEVNFPVFPQLSAEMELGCSVFLQEEDDNKDYVLAAEKNTSDSSEQTLINELTNIFKTSANQHAQNLQKISDDDIGIVEMGGSFYCSGCDFVVNTILAARKHLARTHSGIRDSNARQRPMQTKTRRAQEPTRTCSCSSVNCVRRIIHRPASKIPIYLLLLTFDI